MLIFMLTSPSGTTVSLSLGNGGSSDPYSDTIFDDDASEMITSGTGHLVELICLKTH